MEAGYQKRSYCGNASAQGSSVCGRSEFLHAELSVISPFQFERSLVVLKNVLRVPLKSPLPADESLVDGHPADGLHIFYPIDLYQDNIVSTEGLLAVFGRLQKLEGYGVDGHRRSGMYSILHFE